MLAGTTNSAEKMMLAGAQGNTGKENESTIWDAIRAAAPLTPAPMQQPSHDVLCVPAAAWHAMEAKLAALTQESQEVRRFLRAHLRTEHVNRQRAAVRLQARWRGVLARTRHRQGSSLARWLRAQRRRILLSNDRLHASAPPPCADRATMAPLLKSQALVRGFVVRRRVITWHTQHSSASQIQAVVRGRQSRRAHAVVIRVYGLERRVQKLELQLGAERRAREAHELALRRLWNRTRAQSSEAAAGVGGDQEAPTPHRRLRECENVCSGAARQRKAALHMQATWRARSAAPFSSPTVTCI